MISQHPLKQDKVWYVYQDWTTESVPRCFYCGKGNANRLKRLFRNKHHKNVSNKFGINRIVISETDSEEQALLEEIKLISEFHTFVNDPSYNGIGTNYTCGGEGISGHRDTPQQTQNRIVGQRKSWENLTVRQNRVAARNRPEVNAKLAESAKISQTNNWQNKDYRKSQIQAIKVAQNNPITQEKRRLANSIAAKKQWQTKREIMMKTLQSEDYKLKQKVSHIGKKQRCGLCKEFGHKRSTCKCILWQR